MIAGSHKGHLNDHHHPRRVAARACVTQAIPSLPVSEVAATTPSFYRSPRAAFDAVFIEIPSMEDDAVKNCCCRPVVAPPEGGGVGATGGRATHAAMRQVDTT